MWNIPDWTASKGFYDNKRKISGVQKVNRYVSNEGKKLIEHLLQGAEMEVYTAHITKRPVLPAEELL